MDNQVEKSMEHAGAVFTRGRLRIILNVCCLLWAPYTIAIQGIKVQNIATCLSWNSCVLGEFE